ncbi:hypothetical protein [Serratia marcescens]|uniref:hypothetical protein n=1 Tax=Serratia marcescens TaxID=615 RepID=UPI0002B88F9E|nr:hypothetical protein [Serratia marcescens]EMF05869.1 hypothetical protein F518_10852 [Serratia marcescens VGH107]
MKTASLIAAALLLVCWLAQYIYSRRYKREFDVFYRRYTQQCHFVPAHVAIADGLGSLGTSIKVQWFRGILCGKKIKVNKNQYLPAKTYEFVRLSSSERLQTWMKNNGTLLALEGLLFIMTLIFMMIARIS